MELKEYSNTDLIHQLGRRFKDYRLRNDLSQQQVAEQTGLSCPTISAFERGTADNISLQSFIRLLRAIEELDQLNYLLPALPASPSALLKEKRRKQKASGQRNQEKNSNSIED